MRTWERAARALQLELTGIPPAVGGGNPLPGPQRANNWCVRTNWTHHPSGRWQVGDRTQTCGPTSAGNHRPTSKGLLELCVRGEKGDDLLAAICFLLEQAPCLGQLVLSLGQG